MKGVNGRQNSWQVCTENGHGNSLAAGWTYSPRTCGASRRVSSTVQTVVHFNFLLQARKHLPECPGRVELVRQVHSFRKERLFGEQQQQKKKKQQNTQMHT
jgi:hypothetical protein